MFKGGLPIGRIHGISLRLHYSWFFIFALVTWSLTVGYYPQTYPTWTLSIRIAAGLITSLLFFGSVLVHELMHSFVAQRQGIQVPYITLFILGGVSQISAEPKSSGDEFRMAFAGPLSSFIIGAIFGGLYYLLPGTGGAVEFVRAISSWLGIINVTLAVFNLIPGFPLDGGRILRSIIWARKKDLRSATRAASNVGRAIGYIFIFGGILLVFGGARFGVSWFNGLWIAVIGWFLTNAASGSYRQMVLQDMLQGHAAGEIMTRDCQMVPPEMSLEKLVNEHILAQGRRCFPVAVDGKVMGLISIHNVKAIPREAWGRTSVRDAMTPMDKLKWVKPEQDLAAVMQILSDEDVNQVPVIQDASIVGMLSRDNLVNFIDLQGVLGGARRKA